MGIRKTEADIRRARHAREVNESLIGTGISVTSGGSTGPYTVSINRLNRVEMAHVVRLLRGLYHAADRDPGGEPRA